MGTVIFNQYICGVRHAVHSQSTTDKLNLKFAIAKPQSNTLLSFFQIRPSNWITVCNFKWAFFLLHQAWFLLAPCALVALEWEKGNKPVGSEMAATAIGMARQMTIKA